MVAANFDLCRDMTGVSEGGWSDRPLKDDPGGPTMKGVTLKTYTAWRLSKGLPKPSKEDLKAISDAEVSAIYREQYWTPARCDDLPAGLDYAVFDFAINSGPARAVRVLQEVIGSKPDGIVGAQTLAAVRAIASGAGLPWIIERYQDARLAFLKTLKTWAANPGWAKRVETVRKQASAMAAGYTPPAVPADPVAKAEAKDAKATASDEGKSAVVTGIGAAGAAISQAGTTIQPLASVSQWALYAFIALTVLGVAFTAISIARRKAKAA